MTFEIAVVVAWVSGDGQGGGVARVTNDANLVNRFKWELKEGLGKRRLI